MNQWSQNDTERLITVYPYVKNEIIAKVLGRTILSIQKKANHLNLTKDKEIYSAMKSIDNEGDKCCNWKGGRKYNRNGYVFILDKGNPGADKNGYIFEHRKVMSEHIGRPLEDSEIVHHINGIKDDNRIENLELLINGEHTTLHHTGSKRSGETKLKISEKAKERTKDKRNHPRYKDVPIREMAELVDNGMMVKDVCSLYGISRNTYYKKMGEI